MWKSRVVLFSCEPLFLCSSDDLAITHETGRAIVIKSRYSENIHDNLLLLRSLADINYPVCPQTLMSLHRMRAIASCLNSDKNLRRELFIGQLIRLSMSNQCAQLQLNFTSQQIRARLTWH